MIPRTNSYGNWSAADRGGARSSAVVRTLLLGLGNDLVTDDAIGLRVVEAMRGRLPPESGVDIACACEMGLSLLDWVEGYDRLVLVDAIQTGLLPPGSVHEMEASDFPQLPSLSPHFTGVGEMLALGRELGLRVPQQVHVLAVEVKDPFTIGHHLTPELEAALPSLLERVTNVLVAPV